MSFVTINTNNLTRDLRNNITFPDNYVFVPGNTITGDPDIYHIFTSLADFQQTCGTYGPEDSITYQYVAGILSMGLPVIFKRIALNDKNKGKENGEIIKAVPAETSLSHTVASTKETVVDVKVIEKWGGSYGNNLSVLVNKTDTAYYMNIYYNEITLLESKRLITFDSSKEEQPAINEKLIKALQTVQFEKVYIDVQNKGKDFNVANFDLTTDNKKQPLTGGKDMPDSAVADMLPAVYADKTLCDKILLSPKFITSGGYVDELPDTKRDIGKAMIDLTLKRQDCRALIDLPITVTKEEVQKNAAHYSYQQLSDKEAVPSASMCAPWVYMQVGSDQLWMPPSYAYLSVMGSSLTRGGKVYTPKAGLSTGIVPNVIRPAFEIGSDVSSQWQVEGSTQINPIMKLQAGSYVIAGNSTLLVTDAITGEQNVLSESSGDLTVIEIRRQAFRTAVELQYQYNSMSAFETFTLRMAKFLDAMKTEGAITRYDMANVSTNAEPRKLKIRLDVYLTPTIKYIEINLNISYGSVEMNAGGEA